MEILWKLAAKVLSRPAIANWLIRRAQRTPYFAILSPSGDEVYMDRWWLFNPYDYHSRETATSWCPISIRVHHIRREDQDRDLHDHPWNARTIILKGWYWEERLDDELRVRHPGDTASLRFNEFHRIAAVSPGGVYTLFITGRYRGTWGFLVGATKIPWRQYLGLSK